MPLPLLLPLILFLFLLLFVVLPFFFSPRSFAPWAGTHFSDLPRIHHLASLSPGESLYELGSGDGRVARHLARQNPQAQIHAFELSLPLFLFSRLRSLFSRQPNLSFHYKNIFTQNLSKANVIYLFGLTQTLNTSLRRKFISSLRPGTRLITYDVPLQSRKPLRISRPSPSHVPIYLYQF